MMFSIKQCARRPASTSGVVSNVLSQIAEIFSSEDMKMRLQEGLTAREVNSILQAIGYDEIAEEKAAKVAEQCIG